MTKSCSLNFFLGEDVGDAAVGLLDVWAVVGLACVWLGELLACVAGAGALPITEASLTPLFGVEALYDIVAEAPDLPAPLAPPAADRVGLWALLVLEPASPPAGASLPMNLLMNDMAMSSV